MTKSVGVHEAKTQLSRLIERVQLGEEEPARLGDVLDTLADEQTDLVVSAASAWEIAIKCGLGRLVLPEPPARYVPSRIRAIGAAPLSVDVIDALAVADLPPHHRDPFDRLLVAQARRHGFTLVTADEVILHYDVENLHIT
jgi:PIN domain nuclease of toxin-antitoxin system